jgi:hypothetical protein
MLPLPPPGFPKPPNPPKVLDFWDALDGAEVLNIVAGAVSWCLSTVVLLSNGLSAEITLLPNKLADVDVKVPKVLVLGGSDLGAPKADGVGALLAEPKVEGVEVPNTEVPNGEVVDASVEDGFDPNRNGFVDVEVDDGAAAGMGVEKETPDMGNDGVVVLSGLGTKAPFPPEVLEELRGPNPAKDEGGAGIEVSLSGGAGEVELEDESSNSFCTFNRRRL